MLIPCLSMLMAIGLANPTPTAVAALGHRRQRPHADPDLETAKGVAEAETFGEAVTARRIEMSGTAAKDPRGGGIEVLVHMPKAKKGWRCLIDANTMKLRSKEAIPNPPSKVRHAFTRSGSGSENGAYGEST